MPRFPSKSVARSLSILSVAVTFLSLPLLVGCGGGITGSTNSGTTTTTKTATAATRIRVQNLHRDAFRGIAVNGYQSAGVAQIRNGSLQTVTSAVGTEGNATVPPWANVGAMPMIGAFVRNIACALPTIRVESIRAESGESSPGSKPSEGDGDSPIFLVPTFYFDEYLGLWVDISDTATTSTYALYEDEAKTRPAGSIVTTQPDGKTFPQVYRSEYSFTKGFLAGSSGVYLNTINADGSGDSSYTTTSSKGAKSSGRSSWTIGGEYTWSDSSTTEDGKTANSSATFRADGSGVTHTETTDGYVSDYVYNADGSGRGSLNGPEDGLPATITWDNLGKTKIRYADGTTETFSFWIENGGGGGDVAPVEVGVEPVETDASSNRN